MFERYTEKARRVIFFAFYEASQLGSPYIETEHVLLGILREDKALTNRFLRSHAAVESIRKEIEAHTVIREKVSTSVPLPLSNDCKRVLAYAAEEAEQLAHQHIGTGHLMLGLLRDDQSFAAGLLHERGVSLSTAREELSRVPYVSEKRPTGGTSAEFLRDLTGAAIGRQLDPLFGREQELDAIIEILCSRTWNNPVLVGEPGVGKTVIVEGLAQRIADGEVPPFLADKRILALDVPLIVAGSRPRGQLDENLMVILKEAMASQNAILFIDDLQTLMRTEAVEGFPGAENILPATLLSGEVQCICETTTEYKEAVQKTSWFRRRARIVDVLPLTEADALRVLHGLKEQYEKYHQVTYTDDALKYAVTYSSRFMPDRYLPAKAVEILDAAGTRAKLRLSPLSGEVSEVRKRIRFILHRMESAIANHEFEKARSYSDEERKERDNLRALLEKHHLNESDTGVVGRDDIEQVVSQWTGISVASIRGEGTSEAQSG
jgi:ATP-dependent Clp protease ATP-binding subunit ClpC